MEKKKQHNIKLCTFLLRPTAATTAAVVVVDVLVRARVCVCVSAAALSTVRKPATSRAISAAVEHNVGMKMSIITCTRPPRAYTNQTHTRRLLFSRRPHTFII